MKISQLVPENKWELLKKTRDNSAKIYVAPTDDYFNSRIEGTINANIVRVEEVILDLEAKKKYDDFLLQGKCITKLTPNLAIIYMKYKTVFPFSNRDFVLCCTKKHLQDGRIVLTASSTTHRDYPYFKNSVRADLKNSSWIL